jgi:parvulin-like peptidyl-prolyl isomerase
MRFSAKKGFPGPGTKRGTGPVVWVLFFLVFWAAACDPGVPDGVAALVNGKPITEADMDAAADAETARRRALGQLIEEELILGEADRLGITVTGGEIANEINRIRADYPGGSFQDMLLHEFVDERDFHDRLKRNLLLGKTTRAVLASKVRVDPGERNRRRQEAEKGLAGIRRLRVAHLTFITRESAEAAARELAAGRSFSEAAQRSRSVAGEPDRESTPEDTHPGEPVWVWEDRLPEPFGTAVRALEPGRVSPILESPLGFSIFVVLEAAPSRDQDIQAAGEEAARAYEEQCREEAFSGWLADLKAQARIILHPRLAGYLDSSRPGNTR